MTGRVAMLTRSLGLPLAPEHAFIPPCPSFPFPPAPPFSFYLLPCPFPPSLLRSPRDCYNVVCGIDFVCSPRRKLCLASQREIRSTFQVASPLRAAFPCGSSPTETCPISLRAPSWALPSLCCSSLFADPRPLPATDTSQQHDGRAARLS